MTRPIPALVIVTALASAPAPRKRPDFAGNWTMDEGEERSPHT